jgi:hypothetical protein
MAAESVIEVLLAVAAIALLGRDLRRAWRDPWRRPISLLVAAFIAALLVGTVTGRAHPDPWWLALPAAVLAWEVVRGWRRVPSCHLWEAGIATFAGGLVLALIGLQGGPLAAPLLAAVGVAVILGVVLLWQSRWREPRPWRAGDPNHYERRQKVRGPANEIH